MNKRRLVHQNHKKLHAIKRAKERYGIDLSIKEINRLASSIEKGELVAVDFTFGRKSETYRAKVLDKTVYPVYDRSIQTVTTFLTEGMVKENRMMA